LKKDNVVINFDVVIDTPKGRLFAVRFKRHGQETSLLQAPVKKPKPDLNVKKAHALLGHQSEAITRQICNTLGWTLARGSLGVCEPCALAKAKQKNVPNELKSYAEKDKTKQTAFLDQCIVKDTFGGRSNKRPNLVWWILVLGHAGLKFAKFFRAKNKMIEPTAEFLHQLVEDGGGPAKLRMDNAGENVKLQQRMASSDWKLPIKVEFTARNTPQQNSLAETAFTTMTGRAKALFNAAMVPIQF
jgi:hypothetical protein